VSILNEAPDHLQLGEKEKESKKRDRKIGVVRPIIFDSNFGLNQCHPHISF
jgi:hypothetical protein